MRRADLLIGLALLALAGVYYEQSLGIVRGFASDRLGPAFFPRLLALVLAVLAVTLVVRAGLFLTMLALLVAYALLLPRVGFVVATPVLLGAVIWLLGLRAWPALTGTALGITLALYFAFGRALHVLLPMGPLK